MRKTKVRVIGICQVNFWYGMYRFSSCGVTEY